jgi:Trk-type K+ transport systems, membrane components
VSVSLKVNGVEEEWGDAALSGSFHVLSYATTSGFGIDDNAAWPVLPSAILLFIGIWCGMAGSTSGGLKFDRAVLLFKEIHYRLKKVLHPASINEVRIDRRVIHQEDVSPHILYICLYMMVFLVSVVINLMLDKGSVHAFYATLSSLSNVGPAVRELGTYGSFSAEPLGAKVMYTIDMFLGRVEIYPVLSVVFMIFHPKAK